MTGVLDVATAPTLLAHLRTDRAPGPGLIVLDLTAVTFIDNCGVSALLLAGADLAGRLRILPGEATRRLCEIAGLDELTFFAFDQS